MSEKKIAIVGTAPSSMELAPYDDESWEIWGTSRSYDQLPRWDAWYEFHRWPTIGKGWSCSEEERVAQREDHIAWLTSDHGGRPVYVQEQYADRGPDLAAYPLEEMCEAFPSEYFTNSVSMMLAHAICEVEEAGGGRIGVWGVDMALADSEYSKQRPSCEYFIGVARGKGIPVIVPDEADLLKTARIYGYEDSGPFRMKLLARQRELQQRRSQVRQEKRQVVQNRQAIAGALQIIDQMSGNGFRPTSEQKEKLKKEFQGLREQAQALDSKLDELKQREAAFSGALDDAKYIEAAWLGAGEG